MTFTFRSALRLLLVTSAAFLALLLPASTALAETAPPETPTAIAAIPAPEPTAQTATSTAADDGDEQPAVAAADDGISGTKVVIAGAVVAGVVFYMLRKRRSNRDDTADDPGRGPAERTSDTWDDEYPQDSGVPTLPPFYNGDNWDQLPNNSDGQQVDIALLDTSGLILLVQDQGQWGLPFGFSSGGRDRLPDDVSRILGEVTGWPVPAGSDLDAEILSESARDTLVCVRLVVDAPPVGGGAWGTVEQAITALPADGRLRQLL